MNQQEMSNGVTSGALRRAKISSSRWYRSGAPALLAVLLLATLYAFRSFSDAIAWVQHTSEVRLSLAHLLARLVDAETSQRGFVITGRDAYLDPYENARASLDATTAQLRAQTSDNPAQQERLDRLQRLIGRRIGAMEEPIRRRRERGLAEAAALIEAGHGQQLTEEIRGQLSLMEAEEIRLYGERSHHADRTGRALVLLALLSTASLVLVTGGAWASERELVRQKTAERERDALLAGLERRVAERTAALRAANEDLEAFSYSVSHDLRAPLRGMQGYAMALVEDYGAALDETARHYIARIVAAASRMETLIQDLLAYSHLGREPIAPRPTSLRAAVEEAVEQVAADIQRAQATVRVEGELPSVLAHRSTLVRVAQNLLTNAIKFVPPGRAPAVTVRSERRGGAVRLWVEDNGLGIAAENRERIFNVFERLHSADKFPGTGIGLAIVKKGVLRMGGSLGVESTLGEGARFWIELPAAVEGAPS